MAKTKTFRIGEYAVGGIIKVEITGKVILIKALNMYSKEKEVVSSGSGLATESDIVRKLDNYLNEITTCYYADKVMDWIKANVELNVRSRW